jgi:hypothetical protein
MMEYLVIAFCLVILVAGSLCSPSFEKLDKPFVVLERLGLEHIVGVAKRHKSLLDPLLIDTLRNEVSISDVTLQDDEVVWCDL